MNDKLSFLNVSYSFTPISYLGKTYTITAQEPSIYTTNMVPTQEAIQEEGG